MATFSTKRIKKFLKSKKGVGMIALVILLLAGGVLFATKHSEKKVVASQTTATTKTSSTKSQTPTNDTSTTTPAGTTTPATKDQGGTAGSTMSSGDQSTPATPSLPPAAYADNFAGSWYINFGTMTLTQSGTTVTGSYYNGPQAATGTINGTVNAQTFTGTWAINGTHGPLNLVKGTHTLAGTYNSTFKWCGALKGYQFPTDCGFAGHWVTKIPSNATCSMDLIRTNNTVSGTYCNGTISSATISYPPSDIKLSGTWANSSTSGPFAFFLATLGSSSTQQYFQGNYSNNAQYWCGGSSAANIPGGANYSAVACQKN
jgi:hypothetical protein